MTVRISATDWADGRHHAPRTRSRSPAPSPPTAPTRSTSRPARWSPDETPEYGRSYQTPYADRIRNEPGVPVIAVGAISSWDDVNSLLLAGRADLCALGRPHLYDPHWTLHAAAEQGYGARARLAGAVPRGQPPPADRPHGRPQAPAVTGDLRAGERAGVLAF